MKKILCEVGVAYGSPGGRWDTVFVEIPAVAQERIESFAIEAAKKLVGNQDVANFFLYECNGLRWKDRK